MIEDFTDFQNESLETIAKIDDWSLETLKASVRNRMFEGQSFQRSVMLTLSSAKRPVEIDPKRAELLKKVQTLRDQLLLNYNNDLELKKAGILK